MSIAAAATDQVSTTTDRAFWKITLRLMPYLALLWCLAWVDRVNIGFAKLTMLDDLKCVILDSRLRDIEPMAFDFVMNFAKDNDLLVTEACELPPEHGTQQALKAK